MFWLWVIGEAAELPYFYDRIDDVFDTEDYNKRVDKLTDFFSDLFSTIKGEEES